MKEKILVTGGVGFIGSNLVKYLVDNGNNVRIFDDFSRGSLSKIDSIKDKVEIVNGDICNIDSFSKAFQEIDTVYHFAAINGTRFFL